MYLLSKDPPPTLPRPPPLRHPRICNGVNAARPWLPGPSDLTYEIDGD